MTEIWAGQFSNFFEELWGYPPFAWQKELSDSIMEDAKNPVSCSGNWPEAIALPTASGKTACIEIALFALARQSWHLSTGRSITAPRRIFFVVDRRVIVDETYERARTVAQRLSNAQSGILKQVADGLRQIAHGEANGFEQEKPLAAYVMRGGTYQTDAWIRNPLQPVVVTSTVDQIGSQILFRAYGRSSRKWAMYAGLIAHNSLILLDEAHCAQPFLQTLQAVQKYQSWGEEPLGCSFHAVIMSATPPLGMAQYYEDTSNERLDPDHPLGRRQLAHKPAVLKSVTVGNRQKPATVLAQALTQAALDLVSEQRRAIVVFVNRIATARETFRLLTSEDNIDSILLTGRMRPVDKDAVVRQLQPLQASQSHERILSKPLVVVATQTLEVGADLDFDGLVTECASLDALRQRFGRLNRMGRPIAAQAAIIMSTESQSKEKKQKLPDDPIYGPALAATWTWLNNQKDATDSVDFGISRFDLLARNAPATLNAPTKKAAIMLPAHIDCLVQTAPVPSPSPDVALFLHGPSDSMADVQVCWRADLDLVNEGKRIALERMSLCPPSSNETLSVSLRVFRHWLVEENYIDDSADVEGTAVDSAVNGEGSPILRWRGTETQEDDITSSPKDIRPGDTIVIPANHLNADRQIGDLTRHEEELISTLDKGDQSYRISRAKPILRLHPVLVGAWPNSLPAKAEALQLLDDIENKYDRDPEAIYAAVKVLLNHLADPPEHLPAYWLWLPEVARELGAEFRYSRLHRSLHVVNGNSLVLSGQRRIQHLVNETVGFEDEDDNSASGFSHRNGYPVKLQNHLYGVENTARRFAKGCGLPEEVTESVARAGLLHDLGKADPRFQALLRGKSRWLGGDVLAKSAAMAKTRSAVDRVRRSSGYPKGGRHELLSVRLAESAPSLLEWDKELILHLLASHHGYCRPFAPVVFDDSDGDVEYVLGDHLMHWSGPTQLERLDSGVSERYWKLLRRYGWWGLAWLESLLRLADWQRSEEEERIDGK